LICVKISIWSGVSQILIFPQTTESLAKPSLKPSVVDEESLADVQLSPSITPEADVSIDVTAADSLGADDSAVTESAAAGEE